MTPLAQQALAEGASQISLVLCTTATPAGIVACVAITCYVLARRRPPADCARLQRFLIIPLAAVILGLIASTNHLGRPSNTLYVLMGVGRSPLSNEVVAVVVFTGLAWLGWLLSFARGRGLRAARVLLALSLPAAVFALARIAGAYSIATVITWSLPYTPANLVLAALTGGPVLALCVFSAAKVDPGRAAAAALATGIIAGIALTASECLQYAALQSLQSGLYRAADLVPFYPGCIAGPAALIACGLAVLAVPLARRVPLSTARCAGCAALVLAGLAVARFAFYCLRLTAGF